MVEPDLADDQFYRTYGIDLSHSPDGQVAALMTGRTKLGNKKGRGTSRTTRHVYMEQDNDGKWGEPEEIVRGDFHDDGLPDAVASLTFLNEKATVAYAGVHKFGQQLVEYSLVVQQREEPGVWGAKQEVLICRNDEQNPYSIQFYGVRALTLPADAQAQLPERLLLVANLHGGLLLAQRDASDGWTIRHTGPLPEMTAVSVADDGSILVAVEGDLLPGIPGEEVGLVSIDPTSLLGGPDVLGGDCAVPTDTHVSIVVDIVPESSSSYVSAGSLVTVGLNAHLALAKYDDSKVHVRHVSRCNGQWKSVENVDRTHSIPGRRSVSVDPDGDAVLAYPWGLAGEAARGDYTTDPAEEVYFARREGNACDAL